MKRLSLRVSQQIGQDLSQDLRDRPQDIRSTGSFQADMATIELLPMLYGFSVSGCMSSALSEEGGMGLGTVGFNPPVAERMIKEAGFGDFIAHDFQDPANLYYEGQKLAAGPGGAASSSQLRPAATSAYPDLSETPAPSFCACCNLAAGLFTPAGAGRQRFTPARL